MLVCSLLSLYSSVTCNSHLTYRSSSFSSISLSSSSSPSSATLNSVLLNILWVCHSFSSLLRLHMLIVVVHRYRARDHNLRSEVQDKPVCDEHGPGHGASMCSLGVLHEPGPDKSRPRESQRGAHCGGREWLCRANQLENLGEFPLLQVLPRYGPVPRAPSRAVVLQFASHYNFLLPLLAQGKHIRNKYIQIRIHADNFHLQVNSHCNPS
jgi:hypothetical protein